MPTRAPLVFVAPGRFESACHLGIGFAFGGVMKPSQLSQELREGQSPDLCRRRWIFGLSMAGITIAQIVSLYQVGIVKHLPDPPIDVFDSDKVDASDYAYKRGQTPDGVFMLFTYASTALLAAMGGQKRSQELPLAPALMGLKALVDVMANLELAREEWKENKKLCTYCQTASLLSLVTLALSVPEALRAARALVGHKD